MISLEFGKAHTQDGDSQVYSIPVSERKDSQLLVIAKPTSGDAVTGLKVEGSINGVDFSQAHDTETFSADEVAGLDIRFFPGRQAKVSYTSGVDSLNVVVL